MQTGTAPKTVYKDLHHRADTLIFIYLLWKHCYVIYSHVTRLNQSSYTQALQQKRTSWLCCTEKAQFDSEI